MLKAQEARHQPGKKERLGPNPAGKGKHVRFASRKFGGALAASFYAPNIYYLWMLSYRQKKKRAFEHRTNGTSSGLPFNDPQYQPIDKPLQHQLQMRSCFSMDLLKLCKEHEKILSLEKGLLLV